MTSTSATAPDDDAHMVNYEDYHVVFIDILGFSDLVKSSLKDGDALFRIMDALYEIDPLKISRNIGKHVSESEEFGFVQFSDSIVLYDERTENGFWRLVGRTIEIAINFAQHGTLCRGGFTSGKLHVYKDEEGKQSRPIVFGPAFIEAYSLESTVADKPRIVLSHSSYLDMETYAKQEPWAFLAESYIRRDTKDGAAYIDVFRDIWNGLWSDSLDDRNHATDIANLIREKLLRNLDKHISNPRVFAKYYWFAMRYNDLIRNRIAASNLIEPVLPFFRGGNALSLGSGPYESEIPPYLRNRGG